MRLRLKDIIGAPIESEREGRRISTVKALILDPETGKVAALITSILQQKIISPYDVLRWGKVITVHDRDSIVCAHEILRVNELVGRRVNPILGSRVETAKGVFLGKVFDYEVDTNAARLTSLFIAKSFLVFKYDAAQIPRQSIIRITPKKIVVKWGGVEARVKERGERARAVLPA